MQEKPMKKFLALLLFPLIFPLLAMIPVAPVQAQAYLPHITDLIIEGRDGALDIGDFFINYDGTVTFQIDEAVTGWRLEETMLYVGDEPPSKTKPEKFPYQHLALGAVASDDFYVDLAAADLNHDGVVYIAAKAGLTDPATLNPKSKKKMMAKETAWAQGDEYLGNGSNWITFFDIYIMRVG
jgi:hypothetical protein